MNSLIRLFYITFIAFTFSLGLTAVGVIGAVSMAKDGTIDKEDGRIVMAMSATTCILLIICVIERIIVGVF